MVCPFLVGLLPALLAQPASDLRFAGLSQFCCICLGYAGATL
jgi:hypothetical protein